MESVPGTHTDLVQAVREFVAVALSAPLATVTLHKSLFHDLGVDGDDACELLEGFAARFNVNLDGFDMRQHFGPEGFISPVAFFVELLTGRGAKGMRRLEIADLIKAASTGTLSNDAGA